MDWDHLRFVLAVADAGGLSRAGKALQVDPATITRRLDAVEAHLRCRLFHRSRRGLDPTPAGEKLIALARRMDAEVRAVALSLSPEDRGLSGSVVITATEAVAAGLVAPALPAFRRRYPGISVEIATDIRLFDLGRREADIALRLSRPLQGDLKLRRLGAVGYGLYASPAYLAARGLPQAADGFAGHDLIDWPVDYTVIPQVPWLRARAYAAAVAMRSNSASARAAAAAAGSGIALLPQLIADGDPRLVPIAADAPAQDLWLVSHRDLAAMPRVRAMLDYLAEVAVAGLARFSPAGG